MSLVSWLCKIYDSVQIQAVCLAGNAYAFTPTQTTLADLAAPWDKIINTYLHILNYKFIPNTFLKLFEFSKIPRIIYSDLSEYYIQTHIIPDLSFLPSITGKRRYMIQFILLKLQHDICKTEFQNIQEFQNIKGLNVI